MFDVKKCFGHVLCILAFCGYAASALTACVASEPWSATYSASEDLSVYDIAHAPGGGYVLTGVASDPLTYRKRILIMRISHIGELIFMNTLKNDRDETAFSVTRTRAGNALLFTGISTALPEYDRDLFLMTTTLEGELVWMQTYGGKAYDGGADVIETHDGGFVAIGSTLSFHETNREGLWVVKTNAHGKLLWSEIYRESVWSRGAKILETSNHSLIALGSSGYGTYHNSVWLLRIDSDGQEIWRRSYWETECSDAVDIAQTDNGFVIAARSYNENDGHFDICILRTNEHGHLLWYKTYDLQNGDDLPRSLSVSYDRSGMVFTGTTNRTGEPPDQRLFLLKTDVHGELLWDRIYGGDLQSAGSSSMPLLSGGTLIAGQQKTNDGVDLWLLATDEHGYAPSYHDYQ